MEQLRLDGTPAPVELAQRQAPLSKAQREILRYIGENGSIRALDAGEIVHSFRKPWSRSAKYYATDGSDALKRLRKRGLVVRTPAGHYVSASMDPEEEPDTEYDPATAPWPEGF